ncbi:MAG: hypothetical protein JRN33_07880 [Nitrososphaerota archaeon]|nr:hypothetical protein [Nitrososphaerota archaeon]
MSLRTMAGVAEARFLLAFAGPAVVAFSMLSGDGQGGDAREGGNPN